MKIESLEQRLVLTGTLAGVVFNDLNGDGAQEVGELGIGGTTVFLDTNANGALDGGEASTATLADGSYQFSGLAAGNYTVAQVLPNGWLQTAAGSPGVGNLGEVTHAISAPGTGTILGSAWVNGELYQAEASTGNNQVWRINPQTGAAVPAFQGPGEVRFLAYDGTNFWGTDTLNDKIYHFNTNGVLLPSGHTFNSPVTDARGIAWDGSHLWLADGDTDRIYQLDPSNPAVPLASFAAPDTSVSGMAFDGQHLWVSGGTTDRIYQIDRSTGQVVQSFDAPLVPDANKAAASLSFDGHHLWSSDSIARQLLQVDPGGDHRDVTVVDDATSVAGAIGNAQLATIAGTVFYDGDESGAQGAGEIGLEGRTVFLDHDGDRTQDFGEAAVLTDADGNYQLSVRIGRDYTVAQVLPPVHWRQVSPTDPAHTVTVDASGETVADVNFAAILDRVDPFPTDWVKSDGSITNLYTGLSWFDGSLALNGVTNWSGANTYADISTVGGFGDWRLPSMEEAQQAAANGAGQQGFLYPATTGYWWTSAVSGKNATQVSMYTGASRTTSKQSGGYFVIARDTATTIDDGSAGYTNTSGWTNKSGASANAGDYRQATAGTGSKTATWTFTGLEVGASYKIASSWFAASANASNSPFTIRDGGDSEGTVLINQKVAANDFKVGNTWWEGLGTFTADSTTFTVTLSNQANGTVVADAIRLFKVYASFVGGGESFASGSASDDGGIAALSFGIESSNGDDGSDGGGAGGQRSTGGGGQRRVEQNVVGESLDDQAVTLAQSTGGGLTGGSNFSAHDAVFSLANDFLLDSLLTDLAVL